MPSHPSPLRLDAELTRSAEPVAAKMSRSVPEQIAHWARIGRELERSPDVSVSEIGKVLEGAARYDTLPAREQAVVRAGWIERMAELRRALDLERDFAAAGYHYAEADESGRVTLHEAKTANRQRAASGAKRKALRR